MNGFFIQFLLNFVEISKYIWTIYFFDQYFHLVDNLLIMIEFRKNLGNSSFIILEIIFLKTLLFAELDQFSWKRKQNIFELLFYLLASLLFIRVNFKMECFNDKV